MNAQSSKNAPALSLEKRVLDFLETRTDAENIDKLSLTPAQVKGEKADFFFSRRQVVCEIKSLQTDTKDKVERLMRPIIEGEDAPLFYGAWKIENILKNLKNGEEIKREIFNAITSAMQTLFRKANRQIRTTKDLFNLPNAGGALVIANDLVDILSPEVIRHKIGELFQKRTPQGDFQFPEIEVVWVLCETHFVEVSVGVKALPAMLLARGGPSATVAIIEGLQPEWAAAHGVPLIEMDPNLFDTTRFQEQKNEDSSSKQMPRYELWRKQYRQHPYLRVLDEAKLGAYHRELMAALTAGLLKGASAEDKERSIKLVESFTHFLEEVNERGLDLKKYAPLMQALGKEFKDGKPPIRDISKIEEIASTKVQLEAGKFYTNAHAENYRCIKVENRTATLVFFGMHMGKSLEMVVGVNEPKWAYYWPIIDDQLLASLGKRFAQFTSKNPQWK